MSEHAIELLITRDKALDVIADAINNPELLHDWVYAKFKARVPDWPEHGWELHAVAGMAKVIVTARRKT